MQKLSEFKRSWLRMELGMREQMRLVNEGPIGVSSRFDPTPTPLENYENSLLGFSDEELIAERRQVAF